MKRMLNCKFCGEELIRGGNTTFFAPKRVGQPRSVHTGDRCLKGECLNRAGQITQHHPDAPEYNNGVDYSDGRALYREGVEVA